jgi:hypothetical protein
MYHHGIFPGLHVDECEACMHVQVTHQSLADGSDQLQVVSVTSLSFIVEFGLQWGKQNSR